MMNRSRAQTGRRVAVFSVAASACLALTNVAAGLLSRSASVTAVGFELAGDVLTSLIVFVGMWIASRPPDEDHPYGHGRFEILAGLLVGLLLILAGMAICFYALRRLGTDVQPPASAAIWAPLASMLVKAVLALVKFRVGRRISSAALVADAWNDSVDIVSAAAALTAIWLTIKDQVRFGHADIYGGFTVGLLVIVTGLRVVRDASLELTDTMPSADMLGEIRRVALQIPNVQGVEKCYARKTGLQYHVDLHIEVDPRLTVADSHFIAHQVQEHLIRQIPDIAGVLVHVEPVPQRTG